MVSAQPDSLHLQSLEEPGRFTPVLLNNGTIRLRNEAGTFGRKIWRGSIPIITFEAMGYGILAVLPPEISQWEDVDDRYTRNWKNSYTKPPVFDQDLWYVNYIGHPYQRNIALQCRPFTKRQYLAVVIILFRAYRTV
ncbi:MAG: DUF3943 domain-containing protein [Flavobacteriales bacterium]|nr:DUF3943 domain-containing protein [Flavobacteriales bacterium]